MKKKSISLNSALLKGAAAVTSLIASVCPTLCKPSTGITALDNLTDLIISIMKWAGYILLAAGAALTVKAIIDSQSGQSQPGQIGKALALAAGGAVLLVIETVMGLLGA